MKLPDEDSMTVISTLTSVDTFIGVTLVCDYHHMPAYAVAVMVMVIVLAGIGIGITLGRATWNDAKSPRGTQRLTRS